MESKLYIAMVQSTLIWEDIAANLISFERKLKDLKKGTDLVVLPEMFSTGFTMNTSLAEDMDGTTVQWMIRQAQIFKVHICGSLIIKEKDKVFNRFIFIFPNGEVAHYDKKHLFSMADEDQFFHAGNSHRVVEVNGFKINLMVCYDLRFPVWCRNTYKESRYQYDAILFVANWPSVRSNVWRNLLQARAAENMAYVVGVNRVGVDNNELSYDGSSMMIDPWGTTIVQSQLDKEEIFYGEMDLAVLTKARNKFPVANDADDFELL